jgi:hypothetical protein
MFKVVGDKGGMTVKKIADATKSFKPLIQKLDKKRKATDDNEDDDLIKIIKSTNDKKPKQAKKKGMTEEFCETIAENEVPKSPTSRPSAAAFETDECDGNNSGEDGTKKTKGERKNLVNITQIERNFHHLVGEFKDKQFTVETNSVIISNTPYLDQMWELWRQAVGRNDYIHFDYFNDLFNFNEQTILGLKEIIAWNGSSDTFDKKTDFRLNGIRRRLYNDNKLLISYHGGQSKYKTLNKWFINRILLPYVSTIRAHAGLNTVIKLLRINSSVGDSSTIKYPPYFGCSLECVTLNYLDEFRKDCSICLSTQDSDQESEN